MIKSYASWLNESHLNGYPVVKYRYNGQDTESPVLPYRIWMRLGNELINEMSRVAAIDYIVYRTPEDQGRTPDKPSHVTNTRIRSTSDSKNILKEVGGNVKNYGSVRFTHILGVCYRGDSQESLEFFNRTCEEFAKQENLIIEKRFNTEISWDHKHEVWLYPKEWRGAFQAKRYGL